MHLLFTDEEKRWVNMQVFGFPIKKGCPEKTRKSIEHKKKVLSEQGYEYGNKSSQ